MISLIIDHGNTSTKIKVWDGNNLRLEKKVDNPDIELLSDIIEGNHPERCGICGIEGLDPRMIETLRHFFEERLLLLTPSVNLPLKIKYENKNTLGPDRIATAAGICRVYGNESVLVLDCGTAITADIITSHTFRGGNISPGLSLRFKSLHEAAPALPLVNFRGDIPPFGYDTSTAIRSGVVEGVLNEIEGAYTRAIVLYSVSKVVITGGDAAFLAPLLNDMGLSVEFRPYLLDEGILAIMDYNFLR